jgi:hypothetical protein
MSPRPPAARPVFPGRGGRGRTGAVMAQGGGLGERDACRAERAERARAARVFVSEVLGPGHPRGDVAVLLVSEVFGNSVRYSGSGAPGETVTVAVRAWQRAAHLVGNSAMRARSSAVGGRLFRSWNRARSCAGGPPAVGRPARGCAVPGRSCRPWSGRAQSTCSPPKRPRQSRRRLRTSPQRRPVKMIVSRASRRPRSNGSWSRASFRRLASSASARATSSVNGAGTGGSSRRARASR